MNKAGCCGPPWRSGALAGLLLLLLSAPASAELGGDYGFWRTLGNLASRPVPIIR